MSKADEKKIYEAQFTQRQHDIFWEALSDEVHHMKGDEAAQINNNGMESQLEYLCLTPDRLQKLIDFAKKES